MPMEDEEEQEKKKDEKKRNIQSTRTQAPIFNKPTTSKKPFYIPSAKKKKKVIQWVEDRVPIIDDMPAITERPIYIPPIQQKKVIQRTRTQAPIFNVNKDKELASSDEDYKITVEKKIIPTIFATNEQTKEDEEKSELASSELREKKLIPEGKQSFMAAINSKQWGELKRKIWDEIYHYIKSNFGAITRVVKTYNNNEQGYQEIVSMVFENLNNTDLLSEIKKDKVKLKFIEKYIISIYLMVKYPPAHKSDINTITGLDYSHIRDIANHLNINLSKKKTGSTIDPLVLNSIIDAIDTEIARYKDGLEPFSLNKISENIGQNQSVISYYGKQHFPELYNEIWGRGVDWFIPDDVKSNILERFQLEIEKYNRGKTPSSLNSIATEFKEDVCYSSVVKILQENLPQYYELIWRSNYSLSPNDINLLSNKLKSEVKKKFPDSLSSIGKELNISYDMVRYYAKKWFPKQYNGLWGKDRLTEDERKAIEERIRKEIEKHESYTEPIVDYDNIERKFMFSKNESLKPSSITEIADDFKKSRDTISRYARDIDSDSYDEIWGRPKIPEEIRNSIISDILNSNLTMNRIASKYNVNPGSVSRISLEEVQPNYEDYDHSERFPQDLCQRLGTELHAIIKYIVTPSLSTYGIYIFSEIPYGDFVIDLLLPLAQSQAFYDKLIKNNEQRKLICNKIGIDFRKDLDIVVEHTSYISKKNVYSKAKKYHSTDKITLINITRWFYEKYPNPIIGTSIKNLAVVRHDIFAELFGLEGNYLEDFKKAINLNYAYDLDGMKEFKKQIEKKYFKLGYDEYKKFMDNL